MRVKTIDFEGLERSSFAPKASFTRVTGAATGMHRIAGHDLTVHVPRDLPVAIQRHAKGIAMGAFVGILETRSMVERWVGRRIPWAGGEHMDLYPLVENWTLNAFVTTDRAFLDDDGTPSKPLFRFMFKIAADDAKGYAATGANRTLVAHEAGHAILAGLLGFRVTDIARVEARPGDGPLVFCAIHEAFADLTMLFDALGDPCNVEQVERETGGDLARSNSLSRFGEVLLDKRDITALEDGERNPSLVDSLAFSTIADLVAAGDAGALTDTWGLTAAQARFVIEAATVTAPELRAYFASFTTREQPLNPSEVYRRTCDRSQQAPLDEDEFVDVLRRITRARPDWGEQVARHNRERIASDDAYRRSRQRWFHELNVDDPTHVNQYDRSQCISSAVYDVIAQLVAARRAAGMSFAEAVALAREEVGGDFFRGADAWAQAFERNEISMSVFAAALRDHTARAAPERAALWKDALFRRKL